MAFDFRNIIGKIKDQFKPKTYFNIDTGEVIKKRIYNQLDEKEKSSYIPSVKFDDIKSKLPTVEIQEPSHSKTIIPHKSFVKTNISNETNSTRVPLSQHINITEKDNKIKSKNKHRSINYEQRELNKLTKKQKENEEKNKRKLDKELERIKKNKLKEEIKLQNKRQKAIDREKRKAQKRWEEEQEKWEKRKEKQRERELKKEQEIKEPKKKGRPKGSKNKPKEKTFDNVKPEKPPKKITKDIEQRSAEAPLIGDIETLKQRLLELTRKEYPLIDLSSLGQYLHDMVENNEAYYEQDDGSNPYDDYLIINMEDIDEAIKSVEYYGSTQEEIGGFITHLTNKLNMGALSISEAEDVASIIEQGFLVNGEFNSF